MRRGLSGRLRAVVTTGAGADDGAVIDPRRFPGHTGVAVVAEVVAGDVRDRLAGGGRAVMTTRTGAGYRAVIEPRG